MRPRRALAAASLALSLCSLAPLARAQGRANRWTLAGATVEATTDREGAVSLRLGSQPARRLGRGAIRASTHRVGAGEALVVRVEGDEPGVALVAGSSAVSPEILFAGPKIQRGEDVLDRTESDVLVETVGGATNVTLAERRAEVSLCELGAPWINTRALDASTLRLVARARDPFAGVTASAATAIAAVPVEASQRVVGVPVLIGQARITAGAALSPATALHDSNPTTAWSAGELDFVVARAVPSTIPVERVVLTAPAQGMGALPRAISLVVGSQRYNVTIHEALAQPGQRVAVPIVPPRGASCVAVVVQSAAPRGATAIAELTLASALDREPEPLVALARALDGDQGDGAAQALSMAGTRGVAAIAAALPSLSRTGARRAIRLLAMQHTPQSADALAAALERPELADVAREALVRLGEPALQALSVRVVTDARAADLLLAVRADRLARARAMLPALGAERAVWRAARGPMLALLREANEQEQRAWLAALPTDPRARLRGLSALIEASGSSAVRQEAASAGIAVDAADFSLRFLRISAIASGEAGAAVLAQIVAEERDADLRHEAARALSSMALRGEAAVVRAALTRAAEDRVARVRAASLVGLAGDDAGRAMVTRALRGDRWPSVRAAAAELLATHGPSTAALLDALDDESVLVVRAVLTALERASGPSAAPVGARLIAFARDPRRNPSLRIESLSTLAARCDRSQAAALEQLVLAQIDPALPEAEQAVGHAALAALARVDIVRARALLERMDANSAARTALEAAGRNACR
ncbi:MAG: hypothetical protein U0269_00420 [Polyangiales bacterium]